MDVLGWAVKLLKDKFDLLKKIFFLIIYLFFGCTACGILVPGPGIEPEPFVLEARSLNYWTAREVPNLIFLRIAFNLFHHESGVGRPTVLVCLALRSLQRCSTFGAKTRKIVGKPGQVGYPRTLE